MRGGGNISAVREDATTASQAVCFSPIRARKRERDRVRGAGEDIRGSQDCLVPVKKGVGGWVHQEKGNINRPCLRETYPVLGERSARAISLGKYPGSRTNVSSRGARRYYIDRLETVNTL